MPLLDSLLCLVTEAPAASAALQQAVYLACSLGVPLHVGSTTALSQPALKHALTTLTAEADLAGTPAPSVVPALADESVSAEALQQYIHETGIDLVVATPPSAQDPIPPLATASIRCLLERLDCSVLVVGQAAPFPTLDRLLVPTALSPPAHGALAHATRLASLYDATIDLLHVIDTVPYVALTRMDRLSLRNTSFPERRARRQLNALLDTSPAANAPITPHFAYGDPADQIVRFLNQHPVDLMVLDAPRAPTSSSPLGPVADRVLRRATGPVLLSRTPASATDTDTTEA